jgi:hypothetical protein
MRDLLQSTMGGSIRILTELSGHLWPARVDVTQLELAVLNLSMNPRDAMQMGGTLSVGTANVALGSPLYPEEPPAGDDVADRVSDAGAGMTPEVQRGLRTRLYDQGKGSGLGLSQMLGFAKQFGGGVRIQSEPGVGTSSTSSRRVQSAAGGRGAAAAEPTPVITASSASPMLVGDDTAVREVTAATLRESGYTVLGRQRRGRA